MFTHTKPFKNTPLCQKQSTLDGTNPSHQNILVATISTSLSFTRPRIAENVPETAIDGGYLNS